MQARGRQTRAELIQGMRDAIQEKGVARSSINDVLEATGIKKGSLYFHFADKDELALAALQQAGEDFLDFVTESLKGATPRERLETFLEKAVSHHRQSGFVGGCIFGNTTLEMADADPRYSAVLERVFDDWVGKLAEVIAAGQEAGEIRGDIDPAALGRHAVAAIEGGIMQARLQKSEQPLRASLETLMALAQPEVGSGAGGGPVSKGDKDVHCK
jgi:TetR/AcrR family transcriptional repressor of nem operon